MRRIIVLAAIAVGMALSWVAPAAHAQPPEPENLVSGWFRDQAVRYYDFGANTPLTGGDALLTAPIYAFIYGTNADGSPQLVEGQHNVVDAIPGDPGYSDLWQVMFVTVPQDYVPDSIKSKADIDASGYPVEPTTMLVNCPIVPEGTVLENGEPLVQGWYKDEAVFYPDFGPNPAAAAPIWVLIHGMNTDGTPDFVEGQSNIIDTVPDESGYTDFWRVNLVTVPAGYEPNSLRSAADVFAAGYPITRTDMVVNCPVVSVAASASAGAPPQQLPQAGDGSAATGDSNTGTYLLAGGLAALAAVLLATGAGLMVARRRRS
jgi:hypothetical protein